MKKKGVVIFVFLIIIAIVVIVLAISCGAGKTDKMAVYNLLTSEKNAVALKAKEEQVKYDSLISNHSTIQNVDDLENLNDFAKMSTFIIEELAPYVRFVQNTDVGAKNVQKAYDEYLSSQKNANKKLEEALNTSNSADWELFINVLIEKYANQVKKYNIFTQELLNYTTKACFISSPKTVKYTTLSFVQGFNNYMIQEYVAGNKLSTSSIHGIEENNKIKQKYESLKLANKELFFDKEENITNNGITFKTTKAELAIKFIEGFGNFKDMDDIYKYLSKGMTNLKTFAENKTGYSGSDILIQIQAKLDIYNFISLNSFV